MSGGGLPEPRVGEVGGGGDSVDGCGARLRFLCLEAQYSPLDGVPRAGHSVYAVGVGVDRLQGAATGAWVRWRKALTRHWPCYTGYRNVWKKGKSVPAGDVK